MIDVVCSKCGAESGDDWSQCDKHCPIPVSPHYAAEPVTPAGLREKIIKEILPTFMGGVIDPVLAFQAVAVVEHHTDTALRAISAAGYVIVPSEPTEAMIEAAWLASSTWGIGEAAGQWFVSDTHAGGSTVVMIGSRDGAVAEMNGRNTAASIRAALAAEEKSP